MNGRERVRAALTFSSPDRAPRDLWALPYVSLYRQEELDAVLREWPMDIQRPERSPGSGNRAVRAVASASKTPRWKRSCMMGSRSTTRPAAAGKMTSNIARSPRNRVLR